MSLEKKSRVAINVSDSEDFTEDDDDIPLLKELQDKENLHVIVSPSTRVTEGSLRSCKRRWYILGIFSVIAYLQALVWNTWSPISQSAFDVFPTWTNATIATMSNWGSITYVLFLIPMCWIMDRFGLRVAVVVTAFLTSLGTGLRCITTEPVLASLLINIGQFLNGVAGVVVCSAPPLLSSTWFPPKERTTATALSIIANNLGSASAFALGPAIVHDFNGTADIIIHNTTYGTNSSGTDPQKDQVRSEILMLMYIEFGAAAIATLCIFVYFPSKPPVPPSVSATVTRHEFKEGILKIVRNCNMWVIAVPFCMVMAVFGTWISVLDLSLSTLGVNQVDAGWIGFYTIVTGCIGSLVVARFTDMLEKRMKLTILIGVGSFTILSIWFSLMYGKILPYKLLYLYIAVIFMGLTNSSLYTLFFELAVEISHPVDEGVVGGFLSGLWNLIGTIFLFIFFIPDIGTAWMNYTLVGAAIVSFPFIFFFKEHYVRSDLDT